MYIFIDWPDYTSSEDDSDSEVEAIVGEEIPAVNGEGETTQDHTINHKSQHHHQHHEHHHHNHHHHVPKDQRTIEKSKTVETGGTATKIMNLLSEIRSEERRVGKRV